MLDQEKFFNTYKVQEAFEDSGLSWDTLEKIYDDYKSRLPEMKKMADHLQEEISKEITDGLEIVFVEKMEQVLENALVEQEQK